MIFKQDSVASLFGINNSVSIEPFKEAANVIDSYNEYIKNNTLTAENWNTILNQCDDTLAEHLEHIKGFETTMTGYTTSLQGGIVGYNKVNAAIQQYNSLIGSSKNEQQDLINTITVTNSKLGVYLSGLNGANASLTGYGLSLLTSTAKTIGLTIATTALNAALTMGISVIVTGAIAAFASWINASKEITKNAQAAKDKIASITSDLKANTETVENSKQRYAELAQEVENLGKVNQSQGNLSNDEYKEFLDISNQLAGVFPSLTKGYDDNGNAILNLSGNVDTIVGSLDDLLQKEKELANKQIIDQIPDVYKDYDKNIDNASKKVDEAREKFDNINNTYQQLKQGNVTQAFGIDDFGTFENEDGKDVIINLDNYIKMLDELGIEYKRVQNYDGFNFAGTTITAVGNIDQAFTEKLESARSELQYAKQQLDAEKSSIGSYLNTWLQSDFSYNQIDDSGLQTAVKDIITNFDFTNLPDDVDSKNWDDVSEYLKRNIIFAISNLQNNPEIANALSQVFTNTELMPDEKDAYLSKITSYFGENNPVTSSLQPQVDEVSRLKAAYDGLISEFDDQSRLKRFLESNSINTQEEINYFKKVTKGAKTTTEAIRAYTKAKDASNKKPFSTSEMISGINGLSEGFEELDKIMTSMKDKDKKFDYSLLDDKKFKDNFGGYTKEYDTFIKTITKNPKDIKACQDAFDNLANAFVYGSGVMEHLSDDNADVAKQYLELMGIQNADEVVTAALAQRHAEAAYDSQDLTNATYDEIVALAKEKESTEAGQKAFELYIAQKLLSNAAIDPTGDISALVSIIESLGLASDAWKNYYAAKREQESLSSAEIITGVNGEQIKKVTTDDKGNLLTHRDGKYYSADGTEYKGSTKSNLYSQKSENWLDQKTDVYYEEVAKELEAKAKNVQVSNYTGPKSTNPQKGSSGSKGAKDNSTIDWISRSADLLERESKRLETALQDTWTAYTGLSEEDIERVQELFNMPLSPDSKEVDELMDYASKLGISIGELQKLSENGGLESRQSILTQKIDADQKSLDQAKESLDYYKQSYEEYVSKVPEYRDKIENGGTDIESFTSDQKAQIDKAIQAFDSWKDSEEKVKELQKTIRDEKGTYYDNIVDGATKENEKLADANDLIQKQIDLLNTQGSIVSADMYEEMMSNTEQQIDLYRQIQKTREDELYARMNDEDDPLKVGTDEWYNIMAAIAEAKGQVKSFEKELANQEKQLRELPVTNLEKLGNIYQSILDTIQNWGAEMEASGKTLDADYYQKLINNANTSISNYKEEIEAIQDVMEDYNPGTDNWNEMNDKLQQCNSSISSLVQNMHKWNEELLKLPIDKISDASDSLSKIVDGLNDVKSEHETVISAVTGAISDEIDRLNDEKEAYEDTINDQKEALQDRMDLLDKQNEKLKLQAQYEQALYDLENATTQKTEKVIRNGELTYEANADNLRNAQESVQDALAALKKQELQDQMDALDDALDDYNDKLQDTLDSLQKISDKWSEIASKKEQADNEKTATDILGKNWKDKVLSGNDNDIFQMFSKLYTDNVDQINKYQEQIDSTEHISSLIQEYIDSYKAGTLTYEEAQAGIRDLVSQMNQKMSAMDNLQNIYNYMGKVYDTAADGNSVFAGIQKAFKESGDQLISSLQQYQANAGLISESMSSWQQLTNNVESIKDILEDVKDNLKDTERDRDDDDSGSKKHSSSSNAPSTSSRRETGDSSHGPGVEKHHSGVFSGAVGSSSADKTDKIRVLEAEKLGPNEIPAVLERGEMVFTPEQMEKLVASFSATAYVPDNSWIKNMYPSATVNTKPNIVNVSVGDVKLTDVRDVDGFAKAMGKDFVPLARQALARF
jgi:chromosome segregation ATPase